MKPAPLRKYVAAGSYAQFRHWLKDKDLREREDAVYIPQGPGEAVQFLRGRQLHATDVVFYGTPRLDALDIVEFMQRTPRAARG